MIVNRIRAFFGRRKLTLAQENAALRAKLELFRRPIQLFRSMRGADASTANLDTAAWKMFANLEQDYKALEKANNRLQSENMTLARELRVLKDRALGWERF